MRKTQTSPIIRSPNGPTARHAEQSISYRGNDLTSNPNGNQREIVVRPDQQQSEPTTLEVNESKYITPYADFYDTEETFLEDAITRLISSNIAAKIIPWDEGHNNELYGKNLNNTVGLTTSDEENAVQYRKILHEVSKDLDQGNVMNQASPGYMCDFLRRTLLSESPELIDRFNELIGADPSTGNNSGVFSEIDEFMDQHDRNRTIPLYSPEARNITSSLDSVKRREQILLKMQKAFAEEQSIPESVNRMMIRFFEIEIMWTRKSIRTHQQVKKKHGNISTEQYQTGVDRRGRHIDLYDSPTHQGEGQSWRKNLIVDDNGPIFSALDELFRGHKIEISKNDIPFGEINVEINSLVGMNDKGVELPEKVISKLPTSIAQMVREDFNGSVPYMLFLQDKGPIKMELTEEGFLRIYMRNAESGQYDSMFTIKSREGLDPSLIADIIEKKSQLQFVAGSRMRRNIDEYSAFRNFASTEEEFSKEGAITAIQHRGDQFVMKYLALSSQIRNDAVDENLTDLEVHRRAALKLYQETAPKSPDYRTIRQSDGLKLARAMRLLRGQRYTIQRRVVNRSEESRGQDNPELYDYSDILPAREIKETWRQLFIFREIEELMSQPDFDEDTWPYNDKLLSLKEKLWNNVTPEEKKYYENFRRVLSNNEVSPEYVRIRRKIEMRDEYISRILGNPAERDEPISTWKLFKNVEFAFQPLVKQVSKEDSAFLAEDNPTDRLTELAMLISGEKKLETTVPLTPSVNFRSEGVLIDVSNISDKLFKRAQLSQKAPFNAKTIMIPWRQIGRDGVVGNTGIRLRFYKTDPNANPRFEISLHGEPLAFYDPDESVLKAAMIYYYTNLKKANPMRWSGERKPKALLQRKQSATPPQPQDVTTPQPQVVTTPQPQVVPNGRSRTTRRGGTKLVPVSPPEANGKVSTVTMG